MVLNHGASPEPFIPRCFVAVALVDEVGRWMIEDRSPWPEAERDWKTKYGKLIFDESKLTSRIKIKEYSEFEYQGIKGTEKENMPYIKIRGYDIKMNLNN